MITKEQQEALLYNEAYIGFMEQIHDLRESSIQQMHDRPTDSIQQLAGRILQLDDILQLGRWTELKRPTQ